MKKLMAVFMTALLVFGLVACGGVASAPGASSNTGSASVATGESATPTLDAIKAKGKLVMMTNATFPPFEYIKNGEPTGVDVELAQMVADELGVELEVINMDFDLLTDALNSGKGDLVAAGMSITEERLEQVNFSMPYVDSTLLIVVPIDSSIANPEDLAGLKISVQEATTSDLYVSNPENVDAGEVLRFKDAVDAGNAVKAGKADVAVIDQLTAQNVVNANKDTLKLLENPLATEQYAMAVQKGQDDLLAVVNKILAQAVADGLVEELITKHMDLSKEEA